MQSAVKCDCEFIPHPITPFPPPPQKKEKKEKGNESLVFAIEIFKRQALFSLFFNLFLVLW